MIEFNIRKTVNLPLKQVWGLIGDFSSSPTVDTDTEVVIEQEGDANAYNIGMIRCITVKKRKIRERLESFTPMSSYSYEIISGIPIKNHLGTVTVYSENSITIINWNVRYKTLIPFSGWIITNTIKKIINQTIEELHGEGCLK